MNADVLAARTRTPTSRWPARLDLLQGVSGLFLGLFMWAHMLFVSSILLGADAMWTVTRFFEGYHLFGRSYPGIVSAFVAVVLVLFVGHGLLALRKVPPDYASWRAFGQHRRTLHHADTSLWWVQVLTGLVLMFLAGAHLHQMLVHPAEIGPYQSADRVWSGNWWLLYLVLLFAVELHGGIGLYRLAVKWGVFGGAGAAATRRRLSAAKWLLTTFFLVLGLATLAAYARLGYEHRDHVGERYVPAVITPDERAPRQ